MGTSFKYKCNKCSYEVMTSGKLDYGMLAVTDTYICKSCNEIIDVTVGESGETYTKELALMKKGTTTFDMEFYQINALNVVLENIWLSGAAEKDLARNVMGRWIKMKMAK